MGSRTGIAWTDATYNPWRGCTKVSAGCANCYMYRDQRRYGEDPGVVVRASEATFTAPLRWKEPRKVFVCSWSDFWHPHADNWRDEALDVMARAPQHTYQIVTKRPWGIPVDWIAPPNVWLGVSVEDQHATARVPALLTHRVAPGGVLWLSCEPLIARVTLRPEWLALLGWVVIGGESGPKHRPMELDWLRLLVDECDRAGVPVWVKQDSVARPGQQGRIPDDLWRQEWPEEASR